MSNKSIIFKQIDFIKNYFKVFILCFITSVTVHAESSKISAQSQFITQSVLVDYGIPWGMVWLPNGDMLITMRSGELKILKKGTDKAINISGLPKIAAGGQGGLLDIILHPEYENKSWVYFSFSKEDNKKNRNIAIMRAKLKGNALIEQNIIYEAQAYNSGGRHFGGRLAFDNKDFLYFSIGDRGKRDINPQNIQRDAGKIYRLHDDGRIPDSNPFINDKLAKQAIFSLGHRNPQGMAKHPITGEIWTHEHGPKGGDEVNLIIKGKNYGWPLVSYGVNYSGSQFTKLTKKQGMEQPLWHWTPSIAPSGMVFVTSDKYPSLKGSLLVGSLKFGHITQLMLEGNSVTGQKIIKDELSRVRNIQQGPDGYLYIGIDGQGIFKLVENN
ncbi:hypothetical protein CJF42_09740 [Pseudoalteromonas sp. NBT06-2]|uniref:PQQ-dependent sugar dehydrogenase n=1 Tax=Pseudoalteromonas sp. NBT06-2 TaxID=2025950 RepID=UPI000BA5D4D8|nr:PQQ-dependent sugar dehydrogenase [Pseudoalteromonas sp. NBT06-2]PAJ74592.1 hypothetical protein CJF42_09740 [Pseudoalteromonas sp. NBT06-2]